MSLTPHDVKNLILASLLSDDTREIGGAIDAKLASAVDAIMRRVANEIASATEGLEDGMLRAVERASGRVKAATPTIEAGLTDELLQEIYRAAREEITTLRHDLQRQVRELAKSEIAKLDASRPEPVTAEQATEIAQQAAQAAAEGAVSAHAASLPAPLTAEQATAIAERAAQAAAEAAVAAHAAAQPAPLSEERMREVIADMLSEAEEQRAPAFGRDDAMAVAREVADAAVAVHAASQPAPLTEDDVHRTVAEFLLESEPDDVERPEAKAPSASAELAEEWGNGLPEWLQVAIVQIIGNSTGVFAAQPAAEVDLEQVRAVVQEALAEHPPPSAAFELAELWRDGLPSWMAQAVKQAVGERSASGSGTGEFDEIAMRQMIIDVVRDQIPLEMSAPAAAAAAPEGAGAGLDEPRIRMMIRSEVAEIIAELPHPPSEMELSQLIDTAVDQALAERADTEPARADGPAPGETGVFVSEMRAVVEQLLADKMADRATHAEVDKVVTRRLEASAMQEREAAGGEGVTLADVKRLVREIIQADDLLNRDEVEKLIRRLS